MIEPADHRGGDQLFFLGERARIFGGSVHEDRSLVTREGGARSLSGRDFGFPTVTPHPSKRQRSLGS